MGVPIVNGRDFGRRRSPEHGAGRHRQPRVRAPRYLDGKDPLTASVRVGLSRTSTRAASTRSSASSATSAIDRSPKRPEPSFYMTQGAVSVPAADGVVASRLADARRSCPAVRSELARSEPQLAVDIESAGISSPATLTRQQLGMTLMLIFGATALVLAAVGIYGVIAYASAQRLGEIATRLALGATPADVFWLMMRRGPAWRWSASPSASAPRTPAAARCRAWSTAFARPIRSCWRARRSSSLRSSGSPRRFPHVRRRGRILCWC